MPKTLYAAADKIDSLIFALEQINQMNWREVKQRIESAREFSTHLRIAAAATDRAQAA